MGYSVYYNGEIDISPELSDEHATLLDEALTKSNPALLGITAEDGQGLYHGCDWQPSGGRLSVEGESRGDQDEWLASDREILSAERVHALRRGQLGG
jgi:hypothetical protein